MRVAGSVNDAWCGTVVAGKVIGTSLKVGSVVVGNVVTLVNLVTLLEVGSVNGVWRRSVVVGKVIETVRVSGAVNDVWWGSVVVGKVIVTFLEVGSAVLGTVIVIVTLSVVAEVTG